jgi:hypothetical protein
MKLDRDMSQPLKPAFGPIEKIGFFHFGGDDKNEPTLSLRASLRKTVAETGSIG